MTGGGRYLYQPDGWRRRCDRQVETSNVLVWLLIYLDLVSNDVILAILHRFSPPNT
jgi:hypothetical protein